MTVAADLIGQPDPAPTATAAPTAAAALPEIDTGGLTLDQIMAGIEALERAGMSPERIAAGLQGKAAPQPTPSAPSPRAPTREVEGMVAALRKQGVPDDRIREALAADGYTVPAPDDRTDEQREHDAEFALDPAAFDPARYQFEYPRRAYLDPAVVADLPAFDAAAREFAASIALPPPLAKGLLAEMMAEAELVQAMSDSDRTLYFDQQRAEIAREFGDDLDSAIEAVGTMLDNVPAGNHIVRALDEHNRICSLFVFKSLANWARHAAAWAALRPTGGR